MFKHGRRAALIVLVVGAAPTPSAAQAGKIEGRWVGNGLVCVTPGGAQEAGRGLSTSRWPPTAARRAR
jgi:hypothetical protein